MTHYAMRILEVIVKKMQIIILSRDRVDYLAESLKSVIAQQVDGFGLEILVSDNSETNAVQEFMAGSYPDINYVRRVPACRVWDHYRLAISDASAEYVVLFHDDDILHSDYCKKVFDVFEDNPDVLAIGSNAIKVDKDGRELGLFHTHKNNKLITDEEWLLSQYIPNNNIERGIAPFPSYCYRISALDVDHVNEKDGGACADATFISKKLKYGKIIWLRDPLMKYRVHSQSDSARLTINDYRTLWRYMGMIGLNKHDKLFSDWRCSIWIGFYLRHKLVNNKYKQITPTSWRETVIHKMFLRINIRRPSLTYIRMAFGYFLFLCHKHIINRA